MAAKIFYPYAITLDTSSDDTTIDGISSCSIDEGATINRPDIDGEYYNRLVFAGGYNQMIDFTSMSIKTLLDMCTVDSDCLVGKSVTGTDSLILYSQKAQSGGGRMTGANHLKYLINEALLVPVSLQAGSDTATLTANIIPISNGTYNPIVYSGTAALSGTISASEVFFAGPAKLNGTAISVQSISIDFGLTVNAVKDNGLADATMIHIGTAKPVITITTTDIDTANNFSRGAAIGANKAIFYLRAGIKGGSRQADTTAAHLRFEVNDGMIIKKGTSGSPQNTTIEIHPTYNGSDAPMIYTVAAIT